jgi:hypothetical protein
MNNAMHINEHNRTEWARLATDARKTGRDTLADYFTHWSKQNAAPVDVFDALQGYYRAWLIGGWKAAAEWRVAGMDRIGNYLSAKGIGATQLGMAERNARAILSRIGGDV